MTKKMKIVDPCPHDISEQNLAAQAGGLCPLCLLEKVTEAEIDRDAMAFQNVRMREIINPLANAKVPERRHDAIAKACRDARAFMEEK